MGFRSATGWIFARCGTSPVSAWAFSLNKWTRRSPDTRRFERSIQSTWGIAEQVNTLRNLQGTGHGRTLPTGITEDLAFLVVREACTVAEYFLALLDKSHGR